jgi:phosphohistidine phosphatase SixA
LNFSIDRAEWSKEGDKEIDRPLTKRAKASFRAATSFVVGSPYIDITRMVSKYVRVHGTTQIRGLTTGSWSSGMLIEKLERDSELVAVAINAMFSFKIGLWVGLGWVDSSFRTVCI